MSRKLLIEKTSLMSKYLVINGFQVEFVKVVNHDKSPQIGEVYSGRILSYNSALQAALVDIGNQEVFLPSVKKLTEGECVLLQIIREEGNSKRAKGTLDVSIVGKLVVMIKDEHDIILPKKHRQNADFIRLKEMLEKNYNGNYGVLLRSDAVEYDWATILKDVQNLANTLDKMSTTKVGLQYQPYSEEEYIHWLCEKFSIDEVVFNCEKSYHKHKKKLTPLNIQVSLEPVFLFNRNRVNMDQLLLPIHKYSDFALTINYLEALCVIDVDSGYMKQNVSRDKKILEINKAAFKESIRFLNLMGIGGIVIIDLISMNSHSRAEMDEFIKKYLYKISKGYNTTALPITSSNLLQLIRKSNQQNLVHAISQECPCCSGSGKIQNESMIIDEFEIALIAKQSSNSMNIEIDIPFYYSNETIGKLQTLAESRGFNCQITPQNVNSFIIK